MGAFIEKTIASPPLVIAFRGQALTKVMKLHRISTTDLYSALRKEKIWHIREVECVIIGKFWADGVRRKPGTHLSRAESTGLFSVYKKCDYPRDYVRI